jgi:hypothetical protein
MTTTIRWVDGRWVVTRDGQQLRRCLVCGDELPAGKRPQARTCSARCRKQLSRHSGRQQG